MRDDIQTIDKRDGINSTPESCAYILYKDYQRSSSLRNRSFPLDFESFKRLTSSNCHYCGNFPSSVTKKTKKGKSYVYNGIDRKNNEIGYEIDNCIPCCKFCNIAKHVKSYSDFVSWLNRVAEFRYPSDLAME